MSKKKNITKFLAGAAVGAGIALLFAPQKDMVISVGKGNVFKLVPNEVVTPASMGENCLGK